MNCGAGVGLAAPCRCARCGQEYWDNPKPCGGACVTDDGKLLLVQRAHHPGAGLWDLPGGFCDPAEHPRATARREVNEETGLTLASLRYLGMWIDRYASADPPEVTLNVYYLARADQPERAHVSDETTDVGWFGPESIPMDDLAFPHVHDVIRRWTDQTTR